MSGRRAPAPGSYRSRSWAAPCPASAFDATASSRRHRARARAFSCAGTMYGGGHGVAGTATVPAVPSIRKSIRSGATASMRPAHAITAPRHAPLRAKSGTGRERWSWACTRCASRYRGRGQPDEQRTEQFAFLSHREDVHIHDFHADAGPCANVCGDFRQARCRDRPAPSPSSCAPEMETT